MKVYFVSISTEKEICEEIFVSKEQAEAFVFGVIKEGKFNGSRITGADIKEKELRGAR